MAVETPTPLSQWVVVPWSERNPDLAGLISYDRSAGATLVTLSGPMPAPTSDFILRVASRLTGQIDIHSIVKEGSTWASIAEDFVSQILANETLAANHVSAQINNPGISTSFGVTHYNDNEMACTALTGDPLMKVFNGTLAWDAGPFFFLKRIPPGVVPPPGSNVGQFAYCSVNSRFEDVQYGMIAVTVDNSNAGEEAGSMHFYTAHNINGAPLLAERLVISDAGMFFDGKRVLTE